MANLKREIYDAIIDALDKGDFSYDTDGENIWIDDEQGKTVSVSIAGCEKADEPQQAADTPSPATPQQPPAAEPAEPEKGVRAQRTGDLHRFTVSVHAEMGTVVEVEAPDESAAEEIVNRQWVNDAIKLADLSLHDTRIDCTGRLG